VQDYFDTLAEIRGIEIKEQAAVNDSIILTSTKQLGEDMKTLHINTKEATNKYFAAKDRQLNNAINACNYSDAQKLQMGKIKFALELCVRGRVYPATFGKRAVSIKVPTASFIVDHKMLTLLESDWESLGVYKKISPQGTQYCMLRH
jgi:hypothetical protein